jgi:hypothetical protein
MEHVMFLVKETGAGEAEVGSISVPVKFLMARNIPRDARGLSY